MFRSLQRAMTRAAKRAVCRIRPAKVLAAALRVQKLALQAAKPPVAIVAKPPAAKKPPKPRVASAKPRTALVETVRRIGAGGMPVPSVGRAVKPVTPRGASFTLAHFASEHGNRSYKLYIPAPLSGSPPALPLVVMLHGCTQSPDDFATGTGMNQLADEFRIMVAYPAQPRGANRNKCWNWFNPADQARGGGEPAVIAALATSILRDHAGDPRRIYVAGLSAGGAAAAIVATAYPDVFAAVGVHSGLPIGAARDPVTALVAMRAGAAGSPQTVPMPMIIFHGEADTVVHPRNGRALAARSVATFPPLTQSLKKGRLADGNGFCKTSHRGRNRKSYCEHWTIQGAGHAWQGGHPGGSFTDAAGPDASRAMLRFFLQHRIAPHRQP